MNATINCRFTMNICKAIFLFILLNISLNLRGQDYTNHKEGQDFHSIFQNRTSGQFVGTVNGLLIVENSKSKQTILDFQGSPSFLTLEEDLEEVYDVSFKTYKGQTTSGKTSIVYKTYATANTFSIQLNGKSYGISFIDGACDYVINGLDYSYVSEGGIEYLILRFTDKVKLQDKYNHTESTYLMVMPNSTLIFAIKDN